MAEEKKNNLVQFDINELIKKGQNQQNPMEKAMIRLVSIMFDKSKLFMTSIIPSMGYAKMVVRIYVLNEFFLAYYSKCNAEITLEPISVPPYYRKKPIKYIVPEKESVFKHVFKALNDKLLELTVGLEGKGRTDIKEIFQGGLNQARESNIITGITQP